MKFSTLIHQSKMHLIAVFLRSEEHTSELQSRLHLVCRLLLEKKNTFYRLRGRRRVTKADLGKALRVVRVPRCAADVNSKIARQHVPTVRDAPLPAKLLVTRAA